MPAAKRRSPDEPSETDRLRAEVERLRETLARLTAEKAALEAVCHEDSLTGLLNRRGFERDLARALSYAHRYATPAALLLVDLDRFKPINDMYGHDVGDLALRHAADRLRANLRASDSIGRIGGDEFAILLWQVDEAVARQKAAALEADLDRAEMAFGDLRIAVPASIGGAVLLPKDDVGSVLARADRAMYRRKAARCGPSLRR